MLKLNLSLLAAFLLFSNMHAVENKTKKTSYNVVDQKYDVEKNWWWYEEPVSQNDIKDPEINKFSETPTIKYAVTPVEKKQLDLAQRLLEATEKNNKLQEKILTILEYNFPRTAEETVINKKTGEKCIANSSADCYAPILQPWAQQIPVMAKFLKEPNIDNAKEYLKWQATYFNHMTNIGYGLNFAYRQYGKEAYPTDTVNNLSSPAGGIFDDRNDIKKATVALLSDRIGVYVFLGKNTWNEKHVGVNSLLGAKTGALAKVKNFNYIYFSAESKEKLEKMVSSYDKEIVDRYNSAKVLINPALFKQFDVEATPSVIVTYTEPKTGKQIWQRLGNDISITDTIDDVYNFLLYNGVIEPGNIDEATLIMLDSQKEKGKMEPNKLPLKIKESELKVSDDQVLSGGKRK